MSSPPLSGRLDLGHGRSVAFINCVSTKCLRCGDVIAGDHAFVAIGEPYSGVLHVPCAPYYNYPPNWPHAHPAVHYV